MAYTGGVSLTDMAIPLLKGICFLNGLSDEEILAFARLCRERVLKRGSFLFLEGEIPSGAYFVREGEIKLFKLGYDGSEGILQLIGPGGTLGFLESISRFPHPASAEVVEQAQVLFAAAGAISGLASHNAALYPSLLRCASRKTAAFSTFHLWKGSETTENRLLLFLALLEKNGLSLPSSQIAAGMIGCTRETVLRLLAGLRESHVLQASSPGVRLSHEKVPPRFFEAAAQAACSFCSSPRH